MDDKHLDNRRLYDVNEYDIDGTHFVVNSYIPKNVTDEQFQHSVKKKIERLIVINAERELKTNLEKENT